MTKSTLASSITIGLAFSLGPFATTACGGTDPGTGSGPVTSTGGSAGTAGTSTGGASSGSSTGGASAAGSGGNGRAGSGSSCEAGSGVQGDGADTCPNLAWRCADESVGSPPVRLAGAECSTGHTGGCCSYGDKCLTNTDGTPGSQSAVEVAIGPCQAGCIANPSAQACLDCINSSLASAGKRTLSNGCGTCWTSLISCSFTNCLAQCLAGATAPDCRQCAFDNCIVGAGKFNECSGLFSNGGL
jgi:hypothetical protein